MEKTLQEILIDVSASDFYQILKVGSLASEQEVRDAFHREALDFHPDRYFSASAQDYKISKEIYARIVEAYRTLIHKNKRLDYDSKLKNPAKLEPNITKPIKLVAGFKFFKMAQTAYTNKNWNSAKMNIQIALNESPAETEFKALEQKILLESKKINSK